MAFPDTQFPGLNLVDFTTGADPASFWSAAFSALNDAELIALTTQLRAGQFRVVFNDTGGVLSKGKPVKISGFDAVNGQPEVALAQADTNLNLADGVVLSDIADQALGIIVKRLVITGLDTSSFTLLDDVYLSAGVAGDLTAVVGAQRLGRVTVVNATTGEIEFDVERGASGNNPADGTTLENAASVLRIKTGSVGTAQLKDNDVRNIDLIHVVKSYRAMVNSDVTKNADTTLIQAMSADMSEAGRFMFRALLWFSQANSVANLKLRVGLTGVIVFSQYALTNFGQDNQTFNENTENEILRAANTNAVLVQGTGDFLVSVEGAFDVDAGQSLTIEFAQNVSDANDTTLKRGSFLEVKGMP